MPNSLLLATTNQGKIDEFRLLLSSAVYNLITLKEIGLNLTVIETGTSFEENALIKAKKYSRATNRLCLADDSGIEIDALGGMPGIHSARYGGSEMTGKDRLTLVLNKMRDVPWHDRKARFRTSVALAWPNGKYIVRDGVLEGFINFQPKGANGFGYDPILFIPSFKLTVGELSASQRSQISHRAIAASKILKCLPK